jgi:hypothetical protein
MQIT